MATYTPNHNLKKPAPEDFYNVADQNDNMNKIDAALASMVPKTMKGAAGGVAELDGSGKVPAAQLPAYVDDVLEYATLSAFPATGETGKIYVAHDSNKTYRWSGSAYVEISASLALGETSSTAYPGDKGKVAYTHSQTSGNPHGMTAAQVGAYTKEEILSAVVRALYGAAADATPAEILLKIPSVVNAVWKKIASYETAGAFTWTAPDLFGGKPYVIGVMIIGAGGSGSVMTEPSAFNSSVLGGASGFSRIAVMTVTPNQNYNLIIGVGGIAVSATSESSRSNRKAGNSGGSSSFNGIVANGGGGGLTADVGRDGIWVPLGGQSPTFDTDFITRYGLFGGTILPVFAPPNGGYTRYLSGNPNQCYNPFEGKLILGAGGLAHPSGTVFNGGGKDYYTKKGGGDGLYSTSGNATAQNADSSGCGGGACLLRINSDGFVATSGGGADGAVYIYVQGVAS